ncbi:GNAT family N-acetyltransferase [Oceanospirillum linum]|uniref:GNAT family N-acetyltransferase n=1 Tax=Oceanospirillum linum TaxID=966 RepID=A0A1T1HCY2_OCELI|nr:GNAT family N-acetyltransferase [Oceanospirillum linum]OOV87711.1 GNAT family N-acetyltransferase [Oceanospirillum linum]SEG14767.1 Protein N-acetyltransferase, RimJ/RimL family [Oleiphilus messinensis]SMP10976.1 Protein N-acetyltransferase, RimJ/RimL family [Oceanospirillum linum]
MEIVEAKQTDLEPFFDYLEPQLSDNASDDSPLFLPIAKQHCHVSDQLRASFQNGFRFELGQPGWRKLWLAKDLNGTICGHIDLRHHNTDYSYHRVVLGMGVDQSMRQQGLGGKLLEAIITFCRETKGVDWLDLAVLSSNKPALSLYLKCGFKVVGEVTDRYRIDGVAVSEIAMTLSTKN